LRLYWSLRYERLGHCLGTGTAVLVQCTDSVAFPAGAKNIPCAYCRTESRADIVEGIQAGIGGCVAKLFLDAQQLVVLCHAV
jgi:LSD1 subclass zinc finger protein